MSGPCCQRRHVAQSTAVQGQIGPLGELQLSVLRLVLSGVIGLTEEPSSGFPKSFQAPPVIVSTPHCRQKEKCLAHSVLWACTVGKKKKACTVGYFIWSVFYWRPSMNPHRAYGCPDHVELPSQGPVIPPWSGTTLIRGGRITDASIKTQQGRSRTDYWSHRL